MTAELDPQSVVPLDAYRTTRAHMEHERARLEKATLDLHFALRSAHLLLSESRRRLGLPPLPMPTV